MAPGGRQESRAWRKESENDNRRVSVSPSEDAPVCGADVPFEELVARELRKSQDKAENIAGYGDGKARKKPFLKKGARGWWMRQPGARQKVVKHKLTSTDEETQAASGEKQPQRSNRPVRVTSPSSSGTLSPVMTSPEKRRTVPVPSQTLSPPVSPIRRAPFSVDFERERGFIQQTQQDEELSTWKGASLRSTASTDVMGMKRVRQSFEAKQEREANEMAEFEAIERDLAAEKESYLLERQQQQTPQHQSHGNQAPADHWGLPYSSFVSDLRQQEQLQQHSTSIFEDSMDDGADSALVFDDHSSLSAAEWRTNRGGIADRTGPNGQGQPIRHYGYPPSELSAISFDDSVPWDDGLSFQRESAGQSVKSGVTEGSTLPNKRYSSFDAASIAVAGKKLSDRDSDPPGSSKFGVSAQAVPDSDAPVSSLVQHVFGGSDQADSESNSARLSNEHETESGSTGHDNQEDEGATSRVVAPPQQFTQDSSLSTLKQKIRGKQKPAATRIPGSQRKTLAGSDDNRRAGSTKPKSAVPPRVPSKQKAGKPKLPPRRAVQPADAGMILPAVIEEKLYELEEEVKFYKAETLQLQKRKDYYDQEVKKLASERDEFEQYKQEQLLLIEKEWEKERAKMKKEQKLQDRQWKLRMNATISHQDRKDRGEVESLKAQIVKMQLDEKAHVSKWKAASDNLRQRVSEMEEKNRELNDEIKFLEKDRLEQWDRYERILKEKHEASEMASKSRTTSTATPSPLSEHSELRTMDDIFAVKGTAEELLNGWNFPHGENRANDGKDTDRQNTPSAGFHLDNQSGTVDKYNPKRYSLDRDDPLNSDDSWTFAGGDHTEAKSDPSIFAGGTEHAHSRSGGTGYQWALPDAEGGQDVDSTSCSVRKLQSTSSPAGERVVNEEIEHPGGKKELLYTDGSRKIVFPDGNEKDIDASGHVIIKFTNGDHKELFPDTGISVYYYYEAQTKLTTYPDKRKVYEFPNQQIETSLPDGTTEIQFADGIKKTIRSNGDEFSVFPDGTTMLEQPDGLREVTLLNQKIIRYFPDGEMACVSPSGQETRVRSDSELKQLMESI